MFKQITIVPYKLSSQSAKALQAEIKSRGIRCFRVKLERFPYIRKNRKLILNWGCSSLNPTVAIASNKLDTFNCLKEAGVSIPEYTTDWAVAYDWHCEGLTTVGRLTLTGHSGQGICLYNSDDNTGDAQMDPEHFCKLYVKYKKKKAEYRIHAFNGEVIDVQQKKRRVGQEVESTMIRNAANGWVFCREEVVPPEDVLIQSVNAVKAIGLFFGAVDVIWNEYDQKAYVLEVNTAPGLEGTTVVKYVDAIIKWKDSYVA